MKIDLDLKIAKRDFAELLEATIITGEYKFKGRKHKLRSVIGKKCANTIASGLIAYLTAWEMKAQADGAEK
jgi:hypothetical protein